MNKERNRFKKPTGEKHDKAFTDKWFAYLNGDSKAKEGVTYKNVFLDDFEKMDKTKKYIDAIKRDRKNSAKKNGKDVNVTSPVGDEKPETDTSNLIQVGNQVGYPEEGITYKQFQEKARNSFLGRG